MLARHEDALADPLSEADRCIARPPGARAGDHGAAPPTCGLRTLWQTPPLLTGRSMLLGPVIHGVGAMDNRPDDRACGYGATMDAAGRVASPSVAASAAAARTGGARSRDADADPAHQ